MHTSSSSSNFTMVATTLFGLEEVLAAEIRDLGATEIEVRKRAVSFSGDLEIMYRANLWLRTAIRVLKPFYTFTARNEHELYDEVKAIPWFDYLKVHQTFAIDHAVSSPFFKHSQYAALKTKDAIVDLFRDKTGKRPSVDLHTPDIRINLHISIDSVTISLDSSGPPLFKRGYRKSNHVAPLNEALAAGMILLSGWDKTTNFVDGMCGSGTLPIEAALIAMNIPPGLHRKDFGFFYWDDFQNDLWRKIKSEALRAKKPFFGKIEGSDISNRNLDLARLSIRNARLENHISLEARSFEHKTPPEGGGVLIINPPYGERMHPKDIDDFYKQIGDTFKKKYPGYEAWIISSNDQAMKKVGLRADKKLTLYNGSLNCRFHKFTIYAGTKRTSFK